MGTTKIATKIQILSDIYSESEIYMKWKHRSDDADCEHVIDLDKGELRHRREHQVPDSVPIVYSAVQI